MADPVQLASQKAYESFMKPTADYAQARIECMDGTMARHKAQGDGLFKQNPNAEVGEVCRQLLEHSAEVQMNPQARLRNPGQDLLAPYYRIWEQSQGYKVGAYNGDPIDTDTALKVVTSYIVAERKPDVQQATKKATVALTDNNNQPFIVADTTPALMLDVTFTRRIIDAMSGQATPPRSFPDLTDEQLTNATGACNGMVGIKNGQCKSVGDELSAVYLAKKPQKLARE